MNMKKPFTVMLSFLLVFWLLSGICGALAAGPGDTAEVSFSMLTNPGKAYMVKTVLEYDHEALELVPNDIFNRDSKVALFNEILTACFRIRKDARQDTYPVTIRVEEASDSKGNLVEFPTYSDAAVAVERPPAEVPVYYYDATTGELVKTQTVTLAAGQTETIKAEAPEGYAVTGGQNMRVTVSEDGQAVPPSVIFWLATPGSMPIQEGLNEINGHFEQDGNTGNEKDTAEETAIILQVGNRTLTKSEAEKQVYNAQQYYAMYQQYGLINSVPHDHDILDEVISSNTERFVLLNKAEQIEELKLTEEELAAITESAQKDYDQMIDSVASTYITSGATGDALREEAIAYAESHGFGSLEDYITSGKEEKLVEKITEYTHKDVTVTEEELPAKLDELVAADKASYDADPAAYGTAVNNGTTVYYAPEGYRYVKHILIPFTEEDTAAVSAASTARTTAKTAADNAAAALATAQSALDNAAEGADKTALQAAVDQAQAALDTANADLEAANAAFDSAAAAATANIQAKADEVYALVTKEGADFDTLMAQYGEDPGMKRDPGMTDGYALCAATPFVSEFLEAALALEKVGDISGEVVTEYGIHIIKYVAEIPAGAVALDTVRDALTAILTNEKENAAYFEKLAEWTAESDIRSYPERMGY